MYPQIYSLIYPPFIPLFPSFTSLNSSNGSVNGGASESGNSGGMMAPGGSLQQQSVYSYQSMQSQSQSLQSQSVALAQSKAAFNGDVHIFAGSALDAVSLSSIRSLGRVQNNSNNMDSRGYNRDKGGGSSTRYPQHHYHHHQLYNHLDQQHQHPHHGAAAAMSSSSSLSSFNHPQAAAMINQSLGGLTPPPLSATKTYQPQPAGSSHSLSGLDSLDGGGSHSSDDMDVGPGLGRMRGQGLDNEGYPMHHSITEGEGDVGSLEESSHWDDLLGEGNDGDSFTLGNDGGGSNSQYLGGQHGGQGIGMAQVMGGSMSHHGLQRIPYHERYHITAIKSIPL